MELFSYTMEKTIPTIIIFNLLFIKKKQKVVYIHFFFFKTTKDYKNTKTNLIIKKLCKLKFLIEIAEKRKMK